MLRYEPISTVGYDHFHAVLSQISVQGTTVVSLVAYDAFGRFGTEHEVEVFSD